MCLCNGLMSAVIISTGLSPQEVELRVLVNSLWSWDQPRPGLVLRYVLRGATLLMAYSALLGLKLYLKEEPQGLFSEM